MTAANLGDTLNTTDDITVLAPANPAFEAVPPEALNALLADTAALTTVLTHHVIPGRLTPEELAGTHTTLNNDEVVIEGEGENFTIAMDGTVVGMEASVICGNVPPTPPSTSSTRCSSLPPCDRQRPRAVVRLRRTAALPHV